MKKPFAKLFENEELGQVLITLDSRSEEGGVCQISISVEPEGFGVCSTNLIFGGEESGETEDEAWDKAEAAFAQIDEEKAFSMARSFVEQTQRMFSSQVMS